MRKVLTGTALFWAVLVQAEVPTPKRSVTDPKSIASPANGRAKPAPINDLGFSRGLASAAWSADGTRLFGSMNLPGRYNIWRSDAQGSWLVQITQTGSRG